MSGTVPQQPDGEPWSTWTTEMHNLVPLCLKYVKEGQEEKAFFHFAGDPRKYDDAKQVRVVYQRNTVVHHCIENSLLDLVNKNRVGQVNNAKLERIVEEVQELVRRLPADFFSSSDSALGIYLYTDESQKVELQTFKDEEKIPELVKYPEIPEELANIPTAHIKELIRHQNILFDVDLVTWGGEQYAFKKTTHPSSTLVELSALYRLRYCAAVNPPAALIVDDTVPPRIRGFLTRYMPGGDLGDWLDRRMDMEKAGSQINIPWTTKMNWLISIARVLVAMHSSRIYNGDLKPDNVLLDGHGGVRLVDFGPAGPTEGWGAPEYFDAWYGYFARGRQAAAVAVANNQDDSNAESTAPPSSSGFNFEATLTPAMDIYGFGGLMWAIGEEKNSNLDTRVWRKSPVWYRDIAESCLSDYPNRRPSATGLLFRLMARRLLLMVTADR